ncbi:hypothetical protein DPMN_128957 [Dreissena polymorpha]|uniref:Uncharacterized protein n=1 Tax=Dreissena polymorpha TaxID=45954 RepID=A0A9D4JXV7_DREPO|nr:hypothetical protein DPMN_128957 [Dreissena polymorpha]
MINPKHALFEWLFDEKPQENADNALAKRSTFEILTIDDKFLQLKNYIEDLSELESCYQTTRPKANSPQDKSPRKSGQVAPNILDNSPQSKDNSPQIKDNSPQIK